MDSSADMFERAQRVIPGGVNSPVRACGSVGGKPVFFREGRGSRLVDVDGREYVDVMGSWGPLILGHAHPDVVSAVCDAARGGTSFGACTVAEVELAERIVRLVPTVEMVRLVNSGTEATMTALRLARATTGRPLVLKFTGCYHGHADAFLVAAGSGVATLGLPDSPGVSETVAAETLVLPFNDLAAVETLFGARGDDISSVFVEPVVGNSGLIPPVEGFLEGLRTITERHGTLLVFDEVMTGFRVALGGAQERYGIEPDLTTLGKVIGGGLPVGAFGGRRDLMEQIAPAGPVYQAGTLSGNPLATAAGNAQLRYLDEEDPFDDLARAAERLSGGVVSALSEAGIPATGCSVGSMWGVFFSQEPIHSFEEAQGADLDTFRAFHRACLHRGVFLAPSPFEAGFVSTAHTSDVIDETLEVVREAAREVAALQVT